MADDREIALLFALRAGLGGDALCAAAHLDPADLDASLASLRARRLAEKRGLFRSEWALTELGEAAVDGFEQGLRLSITSPEPEPEDEPLRRVDATLPFVNIAVDPDALRPLVPDVFELDVAAGSAWVSLTASRLKDFGVGRIPRPLRMNFYQATYRAHVRYRNVEGALRRGCYFVRSDTNSAIMSTAANLLPEFRSHRCGTVPIVMARDGDQLLLTVDSDDPGGKVVLVLDERDAPADRLPAGSSFPSMAEARAVIVDFTDSYAFEPASAEVFVLEVERGEWRTVVPRVVDAYLGYVDAGPFPPGSARLDSVFTFRDVPYRWLPLVKEKVVR
jgi:hypothetical protein